MALLKVDVNHSAAMVWEF